MDSSEQTCEEWSSLSGFYTAEEADFMDQLLDNCQVPQYHYGNFNLEIPSTLWPGHESTIIMNNNTSHFPQNAENSNTDFLSFLQATNSIADTTNIGQEVIGDKNFQAHKVFEEVLLSESVEEGVNNNLENSGKRSRSLMKIQKNKGNVKSRKKLKSSFISNTEEDVSPDLKEQNLSSEDDEFNASQELKAGGSSISKNDSKALKSKGKSKSNNRGSSAIDPQGIYAKRRRERINERLRILQSLVPNGTKVDISTMLEEAVLYVKFLQLQIKLLSSDDLWMYSPIAYNGMNIGL